MICKPGTLIQFKSNIHKYVGRELSCGDEMGNIDVSRKFAIVERRFLDDNSYKYLVWFQDEMIQIYAWEAEFEKVT